MEIVNAVASAITVNKYVRLIACRHRSIAALHTSILPPPALETEAGGRGFLGL